MFYTLYTKIKVPVKFNYGLALLRIWMCLEVVIDHFKSWNGVNAKELSLPIRLLFRYGNIAVPVFMLSAFLFTDVEKLSSNSYNIKRRFYRLLVPHIFWTIVYFCVYKLIDILNIHKLNIGIQSLFWQLLLGHSLNQTEWFQIDLILITAIFIIGFNIFKKNSIYFTLMIGYIAILLQYSGINGAMFDNIIWPSNLPASYVTFPLGRIIEMLPYAVIGIFICHFNLLEKIELYKYHVITFSLLSLFFTFNYNIFSTIDRSYGYSGLYLIVAGTCSVLLFYFIPFDIFPESIKAIIIFLSRYTLAIYFMHRLVGQIIYNTFLSDLFKMRQGSIHDCIIIYISCYICAWIISLIPIKIVRDSVM